MLMGDAGRKSVTVSFIKGFVNHGISADLTSNFKLPETKNGEAENHHRGAALPLHSCEPSSCDSFFFFHYYYVSSKTIYP